MRAISMRASEVGRRAIHSLLILTTFLGTGLVPDDHAQARCRLFRRQCCRSTQPCCRQVTETSYTGTGAYCPIYAGGQTGDVWLYYGMKHVGFLQCSGPPRPLYYEGQLLLTGCFYTANCVDTASPSPRALATTPAATGSTGALGKLACEKGFNKNKPVPDHISATPDQYKRTFKDQDGNEHKLHLFKVDMVLGGTTYPDVGHGYGPRHGDMDAYPLVEDVVFHKDPDSFCGYVEWADAAGGPVVRYDVILNKN